MSITKYNDYELLYLSHRSNEKALEIIYEKYRLYLYYKLRKYNFSKEFIEDLVQDCLFELSRSINRFDENRNILFFTFVDTIFERKINKALIKYYKDKEIVTYCIEKETRNLSEEFCQYKYLEQLQLSEKNFETLLSNLLIKEKKVLKEIMIGNSSIKDYVKKHNVTHKQVYNQIQSIRGKYLKHCEKIKK